MKSKPLTRYKMFIGNNGREKNTSNIKAVQQCPELSQQHANGAMFGKWCFLAVTFMSDLTPAASYYFV
jgi:hypothetical protein